MAKPIIEARVIQKVGTAQEWSDNDFVLMDGEMGFERTSTGLPVNFKVGEGDKRYSELPYFHPYIINGSISTTQTISELNALSNGVYSAKGAGTYANGLTANEGQYTTFRKDNDGWHLDARVDVTWESPDLTPIENQLNNHEQRITSNEIELGRHFRYIDGITNNLATLDSAVRNLDETKINMRGEYPDLDNPTKQSSFNRRLFNYVKNGLASSSNFKTNTYNNVTAQFGFGTLQWRFGQSSGAPTIKTGVSTTTFGVDSLRHGSSDDNYTELSAGYVSGKANGVNWNIKKDDSQTQASNIQLPITGNTFRTAIISVNGQFADENGNIVVSGGGGGGYILPPASASTLGGIKVGSGLTITNDGVLSAVGGGGGATYTAGNGINISVENVISAKVDGTTITTNASGQLVASGVSSVKEERIALSGLNTNLIIGDVNGFIPTKQIKIKSFAVTAYPVPTGSNISVAVKKNGTKITTTNATIPAGSNNSLSSTQPVFSSDTFNAGDRLNFSIEGIGSVNTGQNLIATIEYEYL